MRHGPLTTLSVVALILAACSPPDEEPVTQPVQPSPTQVTPSTMPVVAYACQGGQTINVQYVDDATARVSYKGATADLRLTPSGSGARYVGEQWEWWSTTRAGREQATLGRVGPNEQVSAVVLERCSRPLPASAGVALVPETAGGVAPANGTPCRGPQLQLAAEAGDAGAGNRETIYSLKNVGTQTCTVQGHVGLTLQDAQGQSLSSIRTNRIDAAGGTPASPAPVVSLAPQGKAWFGLRWSVVPDETIQRSCPTATRIRVTAPGDTSPSSLDQTLTPCGGKVSVTTLRATQEPVVAAVAGP